MFDSITIGKLTIEYAIDETIPGRHPICACCPKVLLEKDERIVIRKEQANSQGIREGIFLCFNCSVEVRKAMRELLEGE